MFQVGRLAGRVTLHCADVGTRRPHVSANRFQQAPVGAIWRKLLLFCIPLSPWQLQSPRSDASSVGATSELPPTPATYLLPCTYLCQEKKKIKYIQIYVFFHGIHSVGC